MRLEPSKEPLRVTDHAVVRYLERAMGLNVEVVREHILQICSGPAAFGAVCVRTEGVKFEIAGGAVVTVVPDQRGPSKSARDRSQHRIARQRVEA
ncbi:MAG: hypothetical protein JWL86_2806 [Rhizobium sp.]|nr:hypothetical protein [Rhizobium sp.]